MILGADDTVRSRRPPNATTAPRPQIGSKYQQLSSMADSTNRNSYSEREKRPSQTYNRHQVGGLCKCLKPEHLAKDCQGIPGTMALEHLAIRRRFCSSQEKTS
jgi:hypothetical protein